MFTVIICDKRIMLDCQERYAVYLRPFLKNKDVAFCEWNVNETTFDEALPGLRNIVEKKNEWRAVIVNDMFTWDSESIDKINPFDYVNSQKNPNDLTTAEEIMRFREVKQSACVKALNNPLVRVSSWLCGTQIQNCPRTEYLSELPEEIDDDYFKQLSERGLLPIDVEIDRYRTNQYKLLSQTFISDGELFNLPQSVIAIAERSKNISYESFDMAWKLKTEFDYSTFYYDNLYPSKLRYILYDLPYKNGIRNENSYFSFINIILLLAHLDYPSEYVRADRVYKIETQLDVEKIGELFQRYNSKLCASLVRIDEMEKSMRNRLTQPVSHNTIRNIFESEALVPVVPYSNTREQELYCKYDSIGLAKDCPSDETLYWSEQYHSIISKFHRFLREPRRALKTSVQTEFRTQSTIIDDRAFALNEYQVEDLEIKLQDEERKMIETKTTDIYNNAKYIEKLDEASKELKRGISQRMTKSKTITIAVFAIVAYLIGFLPLFITNFNNAKSFSFSLVMTIVVLVLFALAGLVTLFVLRKRLINRFKHFNYVMSGILSEIDSSLKKFSNYLSHACTVMREFYVLDYIKEGNYKKLNVLNYHRTAIMRSIEQTNELFAEFVSEENKNIVEAEPYNFDYSKNVPYEYNIPYSLDQNPIVFLQTGNVVDIPVDYIKSVTLTREELYD